MEGTSELDATWIVHRSLDWYDRLQTNFHVSRLTGMKTSLDHLPEKKQRELARVVEIIHEEFADALEGGSADFKKRGRILKIILFGSYARGTFVDEPHTMKGYRSDYDILVIVNSKKLAEPEYC